MLAIREWRNSLSAPLKNVSDTIFQIFELEFELCSQISKRNERTQEVSKQSRELAYESILSSSLRRIKYIL
mgnify:CR=1 FL=1